MKTIIIILAFFFSLSIFAQNVGINTTTPTNDLSVNGDTDISGKLGIGINSIHTNFQTEITGTTIWGGGILARGNTAGVVLGEHNGVAQIGGHNAAATLWADLAINSGGGNVGIGTTSPKRLLHVNGDYYGRGHVWLHAFEGDGNSGTAYLQARDDSGFSNIGLQLRTQNNGNLVDALTILPNGNLGINTAFFSVGLNVRNPSASIPIIFNVQSANGTAHFQVQETGNAGFNTFSPSVGLTVHNPSASNPFILNVESSNSTDRFQVLENGNAGFNQVLNNAGLNVRNSSAANPFILNVVSANGTRRFSVNEDGNLLAPSLPFGDHANMQYAPSNGQFFYDNSSRRYKRNIKPLNDDFMLILKAQPKTYTRPGDPDRWEVGYIAEEMDSLGLTKLVSYDTAGIPDGFNYEKMILYVNEILKTQQTDLESKEQAIAGLKQSREQLQEEVTDLKQSHQQLQKEMEALKAAVFATRPAHPSHGDTAKK